MLRLRPAAVRPAASPAVTKMAKGIGGEDGPSLWMFIAVVLVWGKLSQLATKTKNDTAKFLELGKNSGGPFQPETTAEISVMTKFVARIPVTPSRLKHKLPYYKAIADLVWEELKAQFFTNDTRMFEALEPLTLYELRAVAKEFGVRETTLFGMTTETVTIFTGFDKVLKNGMLGNDLTRMHKIWAKTGLWF